MNPIIPLFPLNLVQFPSAITPLHIFESRYRQMLKDVMAADKIFGIIFRNDELLLDSEELPLGSAGCTVEVAVSQEMADGRSNILCVGLRRFHLVGYVEGQPYQQAEVEFFEDDLSLEDLSHEAQRTRNVFHRLLSVSRRLKGDRDDDPDSLPELPDDPQAISFIVSAYLDIDNSEKQELLELTDTGERLREVCHIISRLAEEYERQVFINHVAKKNGHGGKAPME
ncbi:MAG: LON peptidase substrate-binding domain-containing protein [Blastocatellia bacterium]|nr:LON peptidase substrate-binding domain-containing protein [Blastocatellia bacterium]